MAALADLSSPIEAALEANLPDQSPLAPRLLDAIRYSVLGGGKRIRPLLTCATATSLGAPLEKALLPACAVEYLHAYSLIHDDLPCMDDDDLRRGRPTCHRAFDEATAVLAGDALQALAFECLYAADDLDAARRLNMVGLLAAAAGHEGMVGGQALDLALTRAPPSTGECEPASAPAVDLAQLKTMHRAKTGALIAASVNLGALVAGPTLVPELTAFGERMGLAFQVIDDLLDVTGSTELLGKVAGADAALGKTTFPAILGLEETRAIAADLRAEALADLGRCGIDSGPLVEIADWIVLRES